MNVSKYKPQAYLTDFKTNVLSMLNVLKENMDRQLKEITKTAYEQNEIVSKVINIIKK